MRFFQSLAAVSGLTFVSRVLGYARDVLIGATFGNSGISDVFFQAFRLPNLFRSLFAEGALNSAFVPIFTRLYQHEGRAAAQLFTRHVLTILACILLAIVVVFEGAMPTAMYILAPGFAKSPEKFELAIRFATILFPYLFFISLSALCAGILNSLKHFVAATSAPILLNLACIIGMSLFAWNVDVAGYALCWSVAIAGVAQLMWVWAACYRVGIVLKPVRPQLTPALKLLFKRLGPGVASAGAYQINLLISNCIASFVPMAVSYLAFADRINQFPLSMTGIAIGTVLLPLMSRHVLHDRLSEAQYLQNRVVQFACAITLPASVALSVLSLPIVVTLFQHGRFTSTMSIEVAKVLSIYSLALPFNVLVKIFNSTFFAHGNTRLPMIMAATAIGANLILTCILFYFFSYYGIAMAAIISSGVNAGGLWWHLHRCGHFVPDARLWSSLPRLLAAALGMGGALWYLLSALPLGFGRSIFSDVLFLTIFVFGGGALFCLLALLFKGVTLAEIRTTLDRTNNDDIECPRS